MKSMLLRYLDDPALPERLAALTPDEFADELLHLGGPEDAPELLLFASPAQFQGSLDHAVFGNRSPGGVETFDFEAFLPWLEALLELGERQVFEFLRALDDELLLLAFTEGLYVLHAGDLVSRVLEQHSLDNGHEHNAFAQSLEALLDDAPGLELGPHLIVSRAPEAWSSLVEVILLLSAKTPQRLEHLLEQCAPRSAELLFSEGDDLDDLRERPHCISEDVLELRWQRRRAAGFVAPEDALAFLRLPVEAPAPRRDPISRNYLPPFEASQEALRSEVGAGIAHHHTPSELLLRTLRELREQDPKRGDAALEELAYLGNVLLAAERASSPQQATEAALHRVGAGIETYLASQPTLGWLGAIKTFPLERLFRCANA